MNIIIKATNVKLARELERWIRMRLEPLTDLHPFLKQGDIELWVEIGRTSHHHRKGDVFRAEVQIRLPGKSIRAEETTDSIKKSINAVRDKIKREIKEYKERRREQD